MKVTAKYLFKRCYGKYAIPAVNVEFMEQVLALFESADICNAPIIIQTTPVARNYATPKVMVAMVEAASRLFPNVVYAFHLDHGVEDHIWDALDSGAYSSVMIDASHDTFEENISRTQKVVAAASKHSVSVEAELGVLSGVEDDISVDESHAFYTNPAEVEEFVIKTGCTSLAVAVGTSHGAYKFSGGQGLQFHILEEISERLPNFPIVLHGGSAVNRDEINRINAAGGSLDPSAQGVAEEELVKSISFGVCKVNIATDTRLLWTRVVREHFRDEPEDFTPIKAGSKYMEAYKEFMKKKFELLGAVNKADELRKETLV